MSPVNITLRSVPVRKKKYIFLCMHSGCANVAAWRGCLAWPECGKSSSIGTLAVRVSLTLLCFLLDIDQVLFSKLLLDNTDAGTLLEWCKVNRGAFVVVR